MGLIKRLAPFLGLVLAAATACGSGSSGGKATVSTQSGGNSGAVVATHASPAGAYLTDAKGRTLYLWKADTSSMSTCSAQCADVWEPYKTSGTPKASGNAQQSMLGTTKRSDGATQVTYADHPLYYYDADEKAGDMKGEGSTQFGNVWTIVAPDGSPIASSSKSSGGSPSSSPSKSSYSWG
jgi:predicted lipoprotein with Yx(FWY)xxD motif